MAKKLRQQSGFGNATISGAKRDEPKSSTESQASGGFPHKGVRFKRFP
jgi:hypothetical protein